MIVIFLLVGCPTQQRWVMEKVPRDSSIQRRTVCKRKQLKTSTLGLDAFSCGCYRPTSMSPPKQNIVKQSLRRPNVYVLYSLGITGLVLASQPRIKDIALTAYPQSKEGHGARQGIKRGIEWRVLETKDRVAFPLLSMKPSVTLLLPHEEE